MLAIDLPDHTIQAANNHHRVSHAVAAQEFWENLQVHKGGNAQFGPPGVFIAIADEVDAEFPLAPFNGKAEKEDYDTVGQTTPALPLLSQSL